MSTGHVVTRRHDSSVNVECVKSTVMTFTTTRISFRFSLQYSAFNHDQIGESYRVERSSSLAR